MLGITAACSVAALACDDPFALQATTGTVRDTLTAFAMTGTPPAFPSAFDAGTGAVVRIQPDIGFDVALDLNADGTVRVIPARLISPTKIVFGQPSVTHQVAIATPAGDFETVTIAPGSGYSVDSLVTVGTGDPVVLRVDSERCQFQLSTILYAKFVVDSVNAATRQIFFRTVRNPNCGFRSFLPGIPED
jgi:hypothetical protein